MPPRSLTRFFSYRHQTPPSSYSIVLQDNSNTTIDALSRSNFGKLRALEFRMISVARPSVLRAVRSQISSSRQTFDVRLSALTRLLSTLAVLEQRGGKLSSASLSAIAAAQKLGGSITGFVAGENVKSSAAAEAAKIKGLEKVIAVDNAAYEKVRRARIQTIRKLRNYICSLDYPHRAYPKITPRYSWTISRAADIHM